MRFKATILTASVLILTVASGMWHGRISNRWGPPTSMRPAMDKLPGIPRDMGDWTLVDEQELAPQVVEVLQCQSYLYRIYRHQKSGQKVNIVILLGPPGPISVHTPEICYSGQGFRPDGGRVTLALSQPEKPEKDEFWSVRMKPLQEDGFVQQVYYAWSAGDRWTKPDNPRWTFRRQPYLYKLQMASVQPRESEANADSQSQGAENFLREFTVAARPFLISP
jgi:hypothetical protein